MGTVMQVGTLPWLLRHELRLWWRELSAQRFTRIWLVVLVAVALALVAFLWNILASVRQTLEASTLPEAAIWIAVAIWFVGFFYTFYQAVEQSIVALFDRGDLELLISSPIDSKVIFASRLLSVALEGFLGCCLVVVPLGGLAVIIGVPRLLGLFPAAIGLSLGTASLAMLLTLWLVRLVGAARARSLVQVLTAILSGTLFLLSQLPNLLRGTDASLAAVLIRFQFLFARGAPLGSDSWLWFPARAIFFDPLSVLLTLVVSAGLAWFTVEALHRTFVSGTQQTALVSQKPRKRPSVLRFRSGLSWVVLLKEWRIIRRNPYLLSRTFLQVLFVIPAIVLLLQDNRRLLFGYTGLVATMGAVAGGALAATLTSICVAGEQAPDLLKSSPNSSASLRRLKLLAALIPVWLLFLPLFLLLVVRGEPWFFALAIFGAATVSSALLRLWNSRPVPLAELFQQRQRRGDIVLSLLEGFCWLGWGFLGFRAALGFGLESLAALVGLGFVIAVGYWRSRQLGSSLGF